MNQIITAEQAQNLGLSSKFVNARYRYQYQKTGGLIICPKCGKYLGVPKHVGGVIVRKEGIKTPICESCYELAFIDMFGEKFFVHPKGVIKYAVDATNTHCKTTIVLTTVMGGKYTATVKLNKEDEYDKRIARQCAFEKLINKIKD